MPIYTQTQLLSDVNGKIKGKLGILINSQSTINQGVRQVLSEIDFTSMRRRTILTPNLFDGLFEYAAPTDLKSYGIITVQNQKWSKTPFWTLVPYEEFMRRQDPFKIAISDYDFIKKVFINTKLNDEKTSVSSLDSISAGGGAWEAFGDAINVEADNNNFVEGSGSIKFDISAAAGTTAGIVNSTLNPVDLSGFFKGSSNGIAWAYVVSTTGLTSYTIRYGSDASNYYTKTVTTQADGTAFVVGWNLLNFDLATFTTVGTPVETAMDYSTIFMNKLTSKVSEVGYRFDYLCLRTGEINNLYYYSKYGWQSNTGAWKENSTTSTDFLNCDTDEYEIILTKCAELAADEVDEDKVSQKQEARYKQLKKAYEMTSPSEALIMINTVAQFIKV